MNELINFIYRYCTDFVINLANLTDLSYYEVNVVIFCVFYPAALVVLLVTYFIQRRRLARIIDKTSHY